VQDHADPPRRKEKSGGYRSSPIRRRSKAFKGESVVVDAIPPERLRQLATDAIERHVDQHQLSVLRTYEAEERQEMMKIAAVLDRDTTS
jgi:hypothetical protein